MMQVYVQGGTAVTLNKTHFVASGGEGEVYAKGSTAYKIYHDRKRMISRGKLQELAAIGSLQVITPQRILNDASGRPVGYTMTYLPQDDVRVLTTVTNRGFRDQNGLGHKGMFELIQQLQEGFVKVHEANCLVVDPNEMNFLVEKDFSSIYFIDTDSYQTPNYPATAIMDSVRDWHRSPDKFTKETDWFGFGVTSFMMFTGLHPYKGKFKAIRGLKDRMKANISVFDDRVRIPKAAYPFDVIPPAYRNWYRAMFLDGKRIPPPGQVSAIIVVIPQIKTVTGTANLDIAELFSYRSPIRVLTETPSGRVVLCADGLYLNHGRIGDTPEGFVGFAWSQRYSAPLAVSRRGRELFVQDIRTKKELRLGLAAQQAMTSQGRIYVKNGTSIHEVHSMDTIQGEVRIISTKAVANCMEKATQLFEGVAVQNMLGEIHATTFPAWETSYTTHLPELNEYTITDAKCIGNVLMVVGSRKSDGRSDRLVFRLSSDRTKYDVRTVENVTSTGLNFAVLDTGVVGCINEDERLELFATQRGNPAMKIVEDNLLGGDMTLGIWGGKVSFTRANKVYSLKTK